TPVDPLYLPVSVPLKIRVAPTPPWVAHLTASRPPSGLKATPVKRQGSRARGSSSSGYGVSFSSSCPSPNSHTRTVRSSDTLASRLPSGLKATALTVVACPLSEACSWPLPTSHILNSRPPILSTASGGPQPTVARVLLSGLKAMGIVAFL